MVHVQVLTIKRFSVAGFAIIGRQIRTIFRISGRQNSGGHAQFGGGGGTFSSNLGTQFNNICEFLLIHVTVLLKVL